MAIALVCSIKYESIDLDQQLIEVTNFAHSNGDVVNRVINMLEMRPIDALTEISSSKPDTVYIYSIDRISAYANVSMAIITILEGMGINILSVEDDGVVSYASKKRVATKLIDQLLVDETVENGMA